MAKCEQRIAARPPCAENYWGCCKNEIPTISPHYVDIMNGCLRRTLDNNNSHREHAFFCSQGLFNCLLAIKKQRGVEPDNKQHKAGAQLQAVEISSFTSWQCIQLISATL